MGLIVPKDEFTRYEPDTLQYYMFTDENGSSVIVDPVDAGDNVFDKMTVEDIQQMFKEWADRGINLYYTTVDSRMVLNEDFVAEETGVYYTADCKDQIGGITYWERYRAGYWFDERQQKDCFYVLITMAPERNESVYKPIFDKMLDRMQDL